MMDVYSDTRQLSMFAEDMIQRRIGRKAFVAASAPEFSSLVGRLVGAVVDGVRGWNRRRRIEAELYALSAHMLEDIGVIRSDIPEVARKWAVLSIDRDRSNRRVAKTAKNAKLASAVSVSDITPFAPLMAAPVIPLVVANNDQHDIAA